MPAMLRPNKKAEKIAYAILGKPANLRKHKTSANKERIEKQLLFEEARRAR
jgi:hypothetical protein